MAKLPNVLDYGDRVSLRSNRVDPVHPSGVEVAGAVAQAAEVFANQYGEKKRKDSRLQYAMAKNEIIAADIAEREALKDRQDYENFDGTYTEGFNTKRDEIVGRFDRLSESDRALLQSESDLIRERGRVVVGDAAKGLEIDLGKASIERGLIDSMEAIQLESPENQNKLMGQALETVTAAVDEGWYTEQEGEALLQKYVSDASTNSLKNMDPEVRKAELELSLSHRKARGAITREEAANEQGSGSIADFLPSHIVKKMLEETDDEILIENAQRAAFDTVDAAWDAFPDMDDVKERDKFIRDALRDQPEARKEAHMLSSQRRERMSTDQTYERADTAQKLTNELYEHAGSVQLDPGMLSTLTRTEQEHIRQLQRQLLEGHDWALSTDWEAWEKWDTMTDREKAAADFDGFYVDEYGHNIPWKAVVTVERARYMSKDREDAEKRLSAGGQADHKGSLGQESLLERALIQTPYFDRKPTAADDDALRERWMRISNEYNKELVDLHDQGVTIDDTKRYEVLGRVLMHTAFTPKGVPDDRRLVAGLSPDERKDAYIPLKEMVMFDDGVERNAFTPVTIPPEVGGKPTDPRMRPEQWIRNQLSSLNEDVAKPEDADAMEVAEVWFYIVTQGWEAGLARAGRAPDM
jgi:hypothetical protein